MGCLQGLDFFVRLVLSLIALFVFGFVGNDDGRGGGSGGGWVISVGQSLAFVRLNVPLDYMFVCLITALALMWTPQFGCHSRCRVEFKGCMKKTVLQRIWCETCPWYFGVVD
jgi:hypothetical protein